MSNMLVDAYMSRMVANLDPTTGLVKQMAIGQAKRDDAELEQLQLETARAKRDFAKLIAADLQEAKDNGADAAVVDSLRTLYERWSK